MHCIKSDKIKKVYKNKLHYIFSLIEDEGLYEILKSQLHEISFIDHAEILEEIAYFSIHNIKSKGLARLESEIKLELYLDKLTDEIFGNQMKLSQFIIELNGLIFNNSDQNQFIQDCIDKWALKVSDKIHYTSSSSEIYQIMDKYIAQSFVVEYNYSMSHDDFCQIFKTQKISEYALSVLYLMISEKLDLPIFGLPHKEKLLLCMAKSHCNNSELVYQEDIKFYFNPGPNGLLFTLQDLELIFKANDAQVAMREKLPKSNRIIVQNWLLKLHQENEILTKNEVLMPMFSEFIKMLKNV